LQVPATSGTNIMFGETDPRSDIGDDANFATLQFTLFDNVKVETIAAPAPDADFNNDGKVDGADFLIWQRGNGAAGNNGAGDADGDGQVNTTDLDVWKMAFGGAATAATAAAPEPASLGLVLSAAIATGRGRRRRAR
jgi:hypothetical protein